jgi:hypothetical protein
MYYQILKLSCNKENSNVTKLDIKWRKEKKVLAMQMAMPSA